MLHACARRQDRPRTLRISAHIGEGDRNERCRASVALKRCAAFIVNFGRDGGRFVPKRSPSSIDTDAYGLLVRWEMAVQITQAELGELLGGRRRLKTEPPGRVSDPRTFAW
jgi:hypothetical protein